MARYATARFPVKEAHEATWARRIALFFVQLLILTVLLHRFSLLTTPVALNLIGVSLAGFFLAIAIAIFSLVRIWFGGHTGAGQAFAAIVIACSALPRPRSFSRRRRFSPRLNDVATSPDEPLAFNVLLSQRPADANPIKDPDAAADRRTDRGLSRSRTDGAGARRARGVQPGARGGGAARLDHRLERDTGRDRHRPHRGDRPDPGHGLYRRCRRAGQGRRHPRRRSMSVRCRAMACTISAPMPRASAPCSRKSRRRWRRARRRCSSRPSPRKRPLPTRRTPPRSASRSA